MTTAIYTADCSHPNLSSMVALLYVAFRDDVSPTLQERWQHTKELTHLPSHHYTYLRYIDGAMIVYYFSRLGAPLPDAEAIVKATRTAVEHRAWVFKWKSSVKTIIQLPFGEAIRAPLSFNGGSARRYVVKIKNEELRRALDTVLYSVNPNKGKQ